jgi:hypothetical protein
MIELWFPLMVLIAALIGRMAYVERKEDKQRRYQKWRDSQIQPAKRR